MSDRLSRIVFACLLLCASLVRSQSVSLAPPPQFTSFLSNGTPNAFGCVFTYNSGTSTPLGTFTDYTGATSNPNPVPLTAGGTANVWFSGGLLYRVVVKTFGGVNCASGSTVYTVDGVNSSLLNTANTWNASQTFNATTFFTLSDLQLVFGSPGTQTTLDIPPTASNLILHGPPITANDTLLSQNATQTVTNKNLTAGTQVNGCGMTNGPGAYVCVTNNSITATVLNSLAILTGAPSTATRALTTSQSGVLGIVTGGAGITGTAIIQQSGPSSCTFDASTVAGDYFQASASVAGNCHDSGTGPPSSPPIGVQILGQVLVTGIGGLTNVSLYGPGLINLAQAELSLPNQGVTGTLVNGLTKQSGAPSTAIRMATTDTVGSIGITVAGAGTTGTATIQQLGFAPCVFDGATTANDYVVISSTTAGNCHDSGIIPPAVPPLGVQVIGQVLSTNVGVGTYNIDLYGPGIITPAGITRSGNISGCVSSGSPCTVTVTWSNGGFPNSTYNPVCFGIGPITGNPQAAFIYSGTQTATTLQVITNNVGTTNPGGFTTISCIATTN